MIGIVLGITILIFGYKIDRIERRLDEIEAFIASLADDYTEEGDEG